MKIHDWETFVYNGRPGDRYIQKGCSSAPVGTETKKIKTGDYEITVVEDGGGELFDTVTVLVRRVRVYDGYK